MLAIFNAMKAYGEQDQGLHDYSKLNNFQNELTLIK